MCSKVLAIALKASQTFKSGGSAAWKYLKVEAAPPMTVELLKGPFGQKIEAAAAKAINSVIKGIQNKQKEMVLEQQRVIRERKAAIEAGIAKQQAEQKKQQESKKAAADAAAKKGEAKRKQKESEAKQAAEAKAKEAEKKASADKKKPAKKKN